LVNAHAYLGFVYDYRSGFVRARAEYEEFLRIAPREHDLRDDVSERLKTLSGKPSFPSLTPQMNLSPTATPTIIPPTLTPAITATKPVTTPVSATPTAAK
jgi:hypothetical protein